MTTPGCWIPPRTVPHICKCGVPVWRNWKWSDKESRHDPVFIDCENAGSKPPTKRMGGTGQIHVCKLKEKTA